MHLKYTKPSHPSSNTPTPCYSEPRSSDPLCVHRPQFRETIASPSKHSSPTTQRPHHLAFSTPSACRPKYPRLAIPSTQDLPSRAPFTCHSAPHHLSSRVPKTCRPERLSLVISSAAEKSKTPRQPPTPHPCSHLTHPVGAVRGPPSPPPAHNDTPLPTKPPPPVIPST